MSKFKIGDRVVVYRDGERKAGVITDTFKDTLCVRESDDCLLSRVVHIKQCRLLKKKRVRKVYVRFSPTDNEVLYACNDPIEDGIEFVEAKRK